MVHSKERDAALENALDATIDQMLVRLVESCSNHPVDC